MALLVMCNPFPLYVAPIMEVKFHPLVRGILIQDGKVLIAHCKGSSNTFLPGGHISPGESTHEALKRELMEELGLAITVGRYLGAIEHQWTDRGIRNHEMNHVFLIEASHPLSALHSREAHLEFFWEHLDALAGRNLQPFQLQERIRSLGTVRQLPWWDSDL